MASSEQTSIESGDRPAGRTYVLSVGRGAGVDAMVVIRSGWADASNRSGASKGCLGRVFFLSPRALYTERRGRGRITTPIDNSDKICV